MKTLEQSRRALPENLIRPLPVQDLEDGGSGDLLSQSSVHANARDGLDYDGGAAARKRQNSRFVTLAQFCNFSLS